MSHNLQKKILDLNKRKKDGFCLSEYYKDSRGKHTHTHPHWLIVIVGDVLVSGHCKTHHPTLTFKIKNLLLKSKSGTFNNIPTLKTVIRKIKDVSLFMKITTFESKKLSQIMLRQKKVNLLKK